MKKTVIIFLVLLGQIAFGQQDSTSFMLSSKPTKVKFYGGSGFEVSFVNQKAIYSYEFDMGLLFSKKIFVGIYSNNALNSTNRIVLDNPTANKEFLFYQAGFKTGYIFKPHKAIHVVASSKIGALSVDYQDIGNLIEDFRETYYLLPQIDAELNLTRHLRLSLGVGYRYTNRSDIFFQQNQANGMIYHLGLSLGKFYK